MIVALRWGVALKHLVLWFGLVISLFLLGFYSFAGLLVEKLLKAELAGRGADIELVSVEASWSGVEAYAELYEGADFRLENLSYSLDWGELIEFPSRIAGEFHAASAVVNLREEDFETIPSEIVLSRLLKSFVGKFSFLPVGSLSIKVDSLSISGSSWINGIVLECDLLKNYREETHVSLDLKNRGINLGVRLKLSEESRHFEADFIASIFEWEKFRGVFASTVMDFLPIPLEDIFISSVADGAGFFESSGYLRWDRSAPKRCGFTILADVGPVEVFMPSGDLHLGGTTFGIAMDGTERLRVFGEGTVDSLRIDSCRQTSGDWAMRVNDAKLESELRLSHMLSLSVVHDDIWKLFGGMGQGRFYLELAEVNEGWLGPFGIDHMPGDLSFVLGLEAEGEAMLADWSFSSGFVEADVDFATLDIASKQLSAANINAQIALGISDTNFQVNSLHLDVGQLDLLETKLGELMLTIEVDEQGRFSVSPIEANFLNGVLHVDSMQLDARHVDNMDSRDRSESAGLTVIAKLMPQFEGKISGQASGFLAGTLEDGRPILTGGRIELDSEIDARLPFADKGIYAREIPPHSTTHKQYRKAKAAVEDWTLRELSVDVCPYANSTHTFRVKLLGESVQEGIKVPIDFDLNVKSTAELMQLFGATQRVELDF